MKKNKRRNDSRHRGIHGGVPQAYSEHRGINHGKDLHPMLYTFFSKICMHLCSFLSNGTKIPFTVVLYSWLVRWYIIIIIIYSYLLLCSTYRWYLEITAASLALHCIALCCISLFIHSSIPPDERRLPQLRCCCYPW